MVEERKIEAVLHSASNLKDVNYLSKMETYAVLKFPPYVDYTTKVDHNGGLNPTWNEKLGFMIPEAVLERGDGHLKVEIFTLGTLGPKFVCEASIPLTDISRLPRLNEQFVRRYPLKTNSGDFHGELKLYFTIGNKALFKMGAKESSFPIFTGLSTSPISHDHTQKPIPQSTSPNAYGHVALPHETFPPTLSKTHDFMPLSRPPTNPPPFANYDEGYKRPPNFSYNLSPLPSKPLMPPPSTSPFLGTPDFPSPGIINVPVYKIDNPNANGHGPHTSYGNMVPLTSTNRLFGGPIGKVLLTDLSKSRPVGREY